MNHCPLCGKTEGCSATASGVWHAKKQRVKQAISFLQSLYRPHALPAAVPISTSSPWQVSLRSTSEQQPATRPVRNYLWIRRPVHRPARGRAHHLKRQLEEVKAVPMLLLFASFIGIAVCLSIFVR